MSLFRRKPSVDPAEVAALRDELAGMQALLATAVASRRSVEQRLSELESAHEAEEQARVEAAERGLAVPPPPPPTVSLDEVQAMAEQAAQLAAQAEQRVSELSDLLAASAPTAADTQAADAMAEELAALRTQVAQLAERVSASNTDSRSAQELAASVETRINQLGAELTCQIDELAGEIEDARRRATASATVAESTVIEELRLGQVRLANEQARYEIAFREDLAHLANQLRRTA